MKRGIMLLGAMLALSVGAFASGEVTIGAKAPELKVAKWFKGTPVKKFEKGKVYVVEFWATWCGPCKASIPHLTEMAKKFKGKASFVGVSVWENRSGAWADDTFTKVDSFVKDFGEKMDYNICADGKDGFMAENWMSAASQNGIPTAFVVDQTGEVAWIGHPMVGLEEAVGQVVDGTFDKMAFKAKFAGQQAEAKKQMDASRKLSTLMQPINEAAKAGKYSDAVAKLDEVLAQNPGLTEMLALTRYSLLLKHDEAGAMKYAVTLSETTFKDDAMQLNMLAWGIVDDEAKLAKPDFEAAIKIATRANELTNSDNAYILDTLAYAYYKSGQLDKAISNQEKAVALLEKTQVDDATRKEIKDRLAMFLEKKKKSGS